MRIFMSQSSICQALVQVHLINKVILLNTGPATALYIVHIWVADTIFEPYPQLLLQVHKLH